MKTCSERSTLMTERAFSNASVARPSTAPRVSRYRKYANANSAIWRTRSTGP